MPRVLDETVISLGTAAGLLNRPPAAALRYIMQGDAGGGTCLEAVKLDEAWVTSVEAVYRFANRRTDRPRGSAACIARAG